MRGAHLLDVVARLPLEPRRSLYVVEVAGKTLLVGTSEMGLSVLSELDGNEVKARSVPKQSFGELVRSAWTGRRRLGGTRDVSAETRSSVSAVSRDVSAETRRVSDVALRDVSAETRGAHVGASYARRAAGDVSAEMGASDTATSVPTGDVPAETRSARVRASDTATSVPTGDVSAETRGAHVGASDSRPAATVDVSAETRGAHVGDTATSVPTGDVSAETRSAHVGPSDARRAATVDVSAETRGAHVRASETASSVPTSDVSAETRSAQGEGDAASNDGSAGTRREGS
ncbi:MAG: flagellar biosynthetic protein FliO [Kofleriaceae bacterium]